MKHSVCIVIILLVSSFYSHAQVPTVDTQALKLGFAIGPAVNFTKSYSASLTPNNFSLQLQKNSPFALKLSTCLIYNRMVDWKTASGTSYKYPSKLSYVAALNIAELSNGQAGLNKSIDGGLGIGLRIDPNFHVVALLEFSTARQLRRYFEDNNLGNPILIEGGVPLNALDETDNNYFYSKAISGFSIRFVYVFGRGEANRDDSQRVK